MSAVTLTWTYPPSVNALYKNLPRGGRAKTKRYKTWSTLVGWEARVQRAGKVLGPYVLYVVACRPDARKRDLGNLEKPISDALVDAGIVEDDHLCQRLEMTWGAPGDTILVTVISTKEAA